MLSLSLIRQASLLQDPFELRHDLGSVLFSREGQRAITRALQRGFEAVAGAASGCEDAAEAEALAGLAEGGVLAGLLDGGGDVLVERSCFNCCGTGHFSNDCPCDAPSAPVDFTSLRSRSHVRVVVQ